MEATQRVTASLVLPMTNGLLHATSKDVPVVKYMYFHGELIEEYSVNHEDLSNEVQEVRNVLYAENKSRFKDKEREGHVEDLLVSTILDPRFKLMNFIGCTAKTKTDAETYLRAAYNADWSPEAIAKEMKKVADANAAPKEDEDMQESLPLIQMEASTTEPNLEVAPIFKKKVRYILILIHIDTDTTDI